ncbi:MAG TPA: glycosyltransferase family 25 protein [Chlamydiales bacterium]|nr:glycosyltransferase family 25 protein [Chlamydiales bacterium]
MLLLISGLFADLQEHFKKAEGKGDYHRIRNIDFIYTINLDQRPEKFASCNQQLNPYGIFPYRFSAVNGWELSLEAINDVGVKFENWMAGGYRGTFYEAQFEGNPEHEYIQKIGRTYFCHCMSRGAIGIVLSHLSILQDAYDAKYKTIWVMEDDIEVIEHPSKISFLIDRLDALVGKDGWDVLFTDRDTKDQNGEYVSSTSFAWRPNFEPPDPKIFKKTIDIDRDFRRIYSRFGAYSMIVRRSGVKKILDHFKKNHIFLPYDMDFYLVPGIRFFTVQKDIVSTQPRAISDNGGAFYKDKEKK